MPLFESIIRAYPHLVIVVIRLDSLLEGFIAYYWDTETNQVLQTTTAKPQFDTHQTNTLRFLQQCNNFTAVVSHPALANGALCQAYPVPSAEIIDDIKNPLSYSDIKHGRFTVDVTEQGLAVSCHFDQTLFFKHHNRNPKKRDHSKLHDDWLGVVDATQDYQLPKTLGRLAVDAENAIIHYQASLQQASSLFFKVKQQYPEVDEGKQSPDQYQCYMQ